MRVIKNKSLGQKTTVAHHRGFIALFSTLILGALVLLVSVGASLRAIEETQTSIGNTASSKASAMANLCAEYALLNLKSVLLYNGTSPTPPTIDGLTCTVSVLGSGNSNRTIEARSTVNNYTKKVKIVISQVSPTTTISLWEEVADF